MRMPGDRPRRWRGAGMSTPVVTGVTDPFNPHHNTTADGVVITLGMKVIDYDRRPGVVIADRSSSAYNCCGGECQPREGDLSLQGCDKFCHHDHWFEVRNADGGTKDFNGDRMQAVDEGSRPHRLPRLGGTS